MTDTQNKTLSLSEILRPFRQNWGLIVFSFLVVFFTVVLLTLRTIPVYEATATFFMRKSGDVQNQIFDIPSVLMQKYVIKNQVAILKSRNLAADVATRLQLSVYRDSMELFGNRSLKKDTSSNQSFLPFQPKQNFSSVIPLFSEVVDRLQQNFNVMYGEDTDIIEVKFRAHSPWEAAVIINTWVDTYQEIDKSDSHGELVETNAFLESKLNDIKNKLRLSEEALALYQKKNQVASLNKETEQLVEQLSTFETFYNQTKIDLEVTEKQIAYLSSQLDESKKNLVADMTKMSSPVLKELQRQLADLITQRAAYEAQILGAGYTLENDIKIKQMDNRLNAVKDRITEETQALVQNNLSGLNPLDRSQELIQQIFNLKTTSEALRAKEKSLKEVIDQYNQKLSGLPKKNIDWIRLERDVQVNSKIYEMIKERYEEIKIRQASQSGIIRIVDRATPPTIPVFPKTKVNLVLGILFGLFFGFGLAFARGFFEDSIRSVEDIQQLRIDVIAGIPPRSTRKIRYSRSKMNWSVYRAKHIFPYLLMQQNGNVEISEVFRTASAKLYLLCKQHASKTLLFTSPNPAEGKSTTVANIAIAMANRGVRTLLVDSDLRGPVLDILFMGSQRNTGLTNFLGNKIEWKQAIRETAVKGLYFMPAGVLVKNAPEILSSNRMRLFVEQTKKDFGLVLFDSPPILPVADAMILASLVDGVVLVVKAKKTTRTQVRKSNDILNEVGRPVIGVIVNGVHIRDVTEYREYYKSYADIAESRRKTVEKT